jgi:hypothetical protein
MFYTDKFLFLHLTKTGGTFFRDAVRAAITRGPIDLAIHRLAFNKVLPSYLSPKLPFYPYRYRELGSHHSFYKSVPERLRHLHLVTIVRDPVKWTLSQYRYGTWRRPGYLSAAPDQNLSSRDELEWFLRQWDEDGRWTNAPCIQRRIGNLSSEFICCLLDPENRDRVMAEHPDIDRMVSVMESLLPPATFLRQENLNQEIVEFLKSMGYDARVTDSIQNHPRKNVSRGQESEVSPEAEARIREREAFLFKFFPTYAELQAPCR